MSKKLMELDKGKYNPLSNVDIEYKLKDEPYFIGVFSRDTLPKKLKENENGIINLAKEEEPGTHWVCYYNRKDLKYVLYFDSYGLAPPEEVKKYLETSGKRIQYNTGEIQALGTNLCGVYCIYLIKELNKGRDYYDIIYDKFEPYPTKENEEDIRDITDKYNLSSDA